MDILKRGAHSRRQKVPVASRRVRRPSIGNRSLVLVAVIVALAAVGATMGLLSVHEPDGELVRVPGWTIARPAEGVEVAILATDADQSTFASWGGDHGFHVTQWTEVLQRMGAVVRPIPTVEQWGQEVLLAPHAYCLSDADWKTISARVQAGAGAMIVGPFGVREGDGAWKGWDRMGRWLGIDALREIPPGQGDFVVVSPDAPVGMEDLAGYRIVLMRRPSQWGIRGWIPAALWTDFLRNPVLSDTAALSAAATAARGAGRMAWVGFDPDLAAPQGREAFDHLIARLLAYCASRPSAGMERWPDGMRAAWLIEVDAEEKFENIRALDEALSHRGLHGTFMCVSDLAQRNRDLVGSVAKRHEIGSHGDIHRAFAGQPRATQISRLKNSASTLASASGGGVAGFRPPEERYDPATIAAAARAGFRYVMGGNGAANGLPFLLSRPDATGACLAYIPRTQPDDYFMVVNEGMDHEAAVLSLRRGLEAGVRHGGIAMLALHTHILATPEWIAAVERILDEMPREDLWQATAGDVAAWWLRRGAASVDFGPWEGRAFHLQIRNDGPNELARLVVGVCVPGNPDAVLSLDPSARIIGRAPHGGFRIAIDPLQPGESRAIRLEAGDRSLALR